jgi:hypothetical protein
MNEAKSVERKKVVDGCSNEDGACARRLRKRTPPDRDSHKTVMF